MTADLWVQGAVVAVTVTQLVIVWYLYRRSAQSSPSSQAGPAPAESDPEPSVGEGSTVRCSECEARNDAEFRFCRNCTAELPGAHGTAAFGNATSGSGLG